MTLLMMGTADALPQAPVEKVVFVEDMTEAQLATAVIHLSLITIGNFLMLQTVINECSYS